jgi:serine O-acetyltransferase
MLDVQGVGATTDAVENPVVNETGFWQQLKEDWLAHGSDWTKPGFRAVAIHRFGNWRMRIRSRWLRLPFSFVYKTFYRHARNVYGIELPYTVKLGRRVVIEHQGGIVIHGHSEIGDDTIIRQGVTLGLRYLENLLDAPKLGKRVHLGAGAVVLGSIVVGDGACIGANAVVLSDVPPNYTAVGVPAKLIPPKADPEKNSGVLQPPTPTRPGSKVLSM